jgi:hypothetical protein
MSSIALKSFRGSNRISAVRAYKMMSVSHNKKNRINARHYLIYTIGQNKCLNCSSDYKLTLDHIIPLDKQGLDGIANLQILCFTCNTRKGNSLTVENTKVVVAQAVRDLFIYRTKADLGKEYAREVFKSAFGEITPYSVIKVTDLFKLYEYANVFKLNGLLFKVKFEELKVYRVPKNSEYIVEYNPSFMLSSEMNERNISNIYYNYLREYYAERISVRSW